MATPWSEDIFLENIYLVVLFLEDGAVKIYDDYDSKGRRHESGDILSLEREWYDEDKPCVVLGWSENSRWDAIREARTYVMRIAKWHGQEEGAGQLEQQVKMFGYDLAGSELFDDNV